MNSKRLAFKFLLLRFLSVPQATAAVLISRVVKSARATRNTVAMAPVDKPAEAMGGVCAVVVVLGAVVVAPEDVTAHT